MQFRKEIEHNTTAQFRVRACAMGSFAAATGSQPNRSFPLREE